MIRRSPYAWYLAYLWALVAVLAFSGCVTTATDRAHSTRRELGSLKPQVATYVRAYEAGVDQAIARCEKEDLPTPKEREQCLGKFAPNSELSKAILQLQISYDSSAIALRELQLALEYIELHLGSPQQ